jgi:hypothetical protein
MNPRQNISVHWLQKMTQLRWKSHQLVTWVTRDEPPRETSAESNWQIKVAFIKENRHGW